MLAKITKRNQFAPDWVPCPGETLRELLNAKGYSRSVLAKKMHNTPEYINELILGNTPLTEKTAIQLEKVLGVKAYFWLGLEQDFQLSQTRQKNEYQRKRLPLLAKACYHFKDFMWQSGAIFLVNHPASDVTPLPTWGWGVRCV